MQDSYDVIVVGGGHAGIEAALAARRFGCSVMLITADLERIGEMSCNPAIGGIAKGTVVREIDALDGSMARTADETRLQFRMLNISKGHAVWGPRVQSDAGVYARKQREVLRRKGIALIQDEVVSLHGENRRISGVRCIENGCIKGKTMVLAAGTFLKGRLYRGKDEWPGGRIDDIASDSLEEDLRRRMFHVERFKTGTPPRVFRSSVDLEELIMQPSDDGEYRFSFTKSRLSRMKEECYITTTNRMTKNAAVKYMSESPLMTGRIEGTGPRYCPSYEDKIVKFPEREKHNIYVEPMGFGSELLYLNGLSTSLPKAAQLLMVRSLRGFGEAEIAVYGYAVEYSYLHHSEIESTLRLSRSENVFAAGQICGTSGYEEAAALGLIAGANAARVVQEKEPIAPSRERSYIGVMIDDITKRGTDEPYRLFSSRSENRLHLRQDNADRRLRKLGVKLEVLSGSRERRHRRTAFESQEIEKILSTAKFKGEKASILCRRPGADVEDMLKKIPQLAAYHSELVRSVMLDEKYRGYIDRSARRNETTRRASGVKLQDIESYMGIEELCWEAREVLERERPVDLAEAGSIPGVRPTDIEGLLVYLGRKRSTWNTDLPEESTGE